MTANLTSPYIPPHYVSDLAGDIFQWLTRNLPEPFRRLTEQVESFTTFSDEITPDSFAEAAQTLEALAAAEAPVDLDRLLDDLEDAVRSARLREHGDQTYANLLGVVTFCIFPAVRRGAEAERAHAGAPRHPKARQ